jgi:hypothetical protein
MGAQGVLRQARLRRVARSTGPLASSVALVLALAASPSGAAEAARPAVPRAIREPVRLTAGASSELMGVLGNDEKSLYFVSDASGTMDVMLQSPIQSAPTTLSGGLGDAAWPKIAPDGKHLGYLSFENDATGDVCVRDIAGREAGPARCLTNAESAELMLEWWDNGSLLVLSRRGLHGDFQLLRMPLDGTAPSTLLARNMVGVAVSPDRRWLAYIPVDKAAPDVGITFAQRAAVGVGLQRLGGSAAPSLYVPPLPGVTGSVAFSPGGDFLEFTQFLNDTNRDGTIDGDDNAVIFRVPFLGDRPAPIAAAGEPEQLTSARWDCHYPSPARNVLIASCSHEGSLDVYSLPLDGAVPREWNDRRLLGEIAAARDLWTKLLLSARRLALAPTPASKEPILLEMMGLHLELGEYESAIFYADQRLVSPEARRFGQVLAELARHRRADLALIRGEPSAQYIESERARAAALGEHLDGAPPRVQALSRLVESEIEDDIGDKGAALAAFEKVDINGLGDPEVAPIAARRAERLYRLRADRRSLLEVYRKLAGLPVLTTARRLEYAQRFVSELRRGRARASRPEALQAARQGLDDSSELALLLDVELILSKLDDAGEEAVRAELFSLYKKNKDADRRRALVLSALRAAANAGNEYIQYQFVTSWISSLSPAAPERKYGEELYDDIVLDRAYGEGQQGALAESRGYFYGSTLATDSLEAHIGFIEARMAEGASAAQGGKRPAKGEAEAAKNIDEVYQKRFARDPDSPVYAFVKAYRIARGLPHQGSADRHEEDVEKVIGLLSGVAEALPKQPQVHQLWGFVLHQRARRNGSREAAVAANRQYLLALDLARDDERLTATLLHRLGLLQASLGNHGAALRYLLRRDELPHPRPLEELGLRVATARSAWHTGDTALAEAQMRSASELLERTPTLAPYAALVVDRLGLSLAAAGEAAAAREQYAELDELLAHDTSGAPVNRVKAKVGLAASAIESNEPQRAIASLDEAESVLSKASALEPRLDVVWRRSLIDDYHYSPLQYRALIAGLRAGAYRALGDFGAARDAMLSRVELLAQRLEQTGTDEDRLELAQAYHHLAKLQDRLGDVNAAAAAVERGLELSDAYDENTGSEVNDAGLALIRDYAELHLYRGVPASVLHRDLRGELSRVYAVICKYRNPRWSMQRFLFKTYLTELALGKETLTPTTEEKSP